MLKMLMILLIILNMLLRNQSNIVLNLKNVVVKNHTEEEQILKLMEKDIIKGETQFSTYLKDTIQKKTISEARIANANAQKSLERCQEFLKNHMDASKNVIANLDLVDAQERDAIEMDNYMSNLSALSYQRIGLGMNRELIEMMRNIVNM